MSTQKEIPARKDVPAQYKWDLTKIYANDAEWEKDLKRIPELTEKVVAFKGKLASGADTLLAALKADEELSKVLENVFHYASLLSCADQGDSSAQEKENRAMMAYTQSQAQLSFYTPELLAIPDSNINAWIKEERFADYRIYIQKILHAKPHVLSEKEVVLSNENMTLFNDFEKAKGEKLVSLTPTIYPELNVLSVYQFI